MAMANFLSDLGSAIRAGTLPESHVHWDKTSLSLSPSINTHTHTHSHVYEEIKGQPQQTRGLNFIVVVVVCIIGVFVSGMIINLQWTWISTIFGCFYIEQNILLWRSCRFSQPWTVWCAIMLPSPHPLRATMRWIYGFGLSNYNCLTNSEFQQNNWPRKLSG